MSRQRHLGSIIVGAAVLASLGYLGWAWANQASSVDERQEAARKRVAEFEQAQESAEPSQPELAFGESALTSGNLLFINRIPGEDYQRLSKLTPTGGRTNLGTLKCARAHASGDRLICLAPASTIRYRVMVFNIESVEPQLLSAWNALLPSRVRVADDGKYATTTVFTSGSSYADVGQFATIVELIDLSGDEITRTELKTFSTPSSHRDLFNDPSGNFWGVTFGSKGDFYATYGTDSQTVIVQGSQATKTLSVTEWVGSCPSLSPDGKHLVFKKETESGYQLSLVDLETNKTTALGETRSVDDQVEWLNNETIAYALHVEGSPTDDATPEFDVWKLDTTTPDANPELLIPQGDSPISYIK